MLEAPNLTLHTKECNPDKDIHTITPTIQIQSLDANIFDHTWAYIAFIPLTRLQRLWHKYTQNKTQHMADFLQPPSQEILWLQLCYVAILQKKINQKNIITLKTTTKHSTHLQCTYS
jgi:hypothetical protein